MTTIQDHKDYFTVMSGDVHKLILQYLEPVDLASALRVSKVWRKRAKDDAVWRSLVQKLGQDPEKYGKKHIYRYVVEELKENIEWINGLAMKPSFVEEILPVNSFESAMENLRILLLWRQAYKKLDRWCYRQSELNIGECSHPETFKTLDESLEKVQLFNSLTEKLIPFLFLATKLELDQEMIPDAVEERDRVIRNASVLELADKDFVIAAVKENFWALPYTDHSLMKDRDFVLTLLEVYDSRFKDTFDVLMNDKNFISDCIKENPVLLQGVDWKLRNNKDVVLAAVKQEGISLEYASRELRNDKDVVLAAIEQASEVRYFIGDELMKDPSFIQALDDLDEQALKALDDGED